MRKIYSFLLLLLWSTVSVAQNPYLKTAYKGPDSSIILDYGYGKVLSVKRTGSDFTYYLGDVSTGAVTVIPYNKPYDINGLTQANSDHAYAWVTPYGALISGQTLGSSPGSGLVSLYEWHQGVLNKLADQMFNVHTAGDYAIWSTVPGAGGGLMLRNLATGQQTLVADSSIQAANVAANGMVVYSTGQYLYTYKNGVNKLIYHLIPSQYPDGPEYIYEPETDGERVTFLNYREQDATQAFLYEQDSVTLLLTGGDYGGYAEFLMNVTRPIINNGYIAGVNLTSPYYYTTKGKVYTRDRQGTFRDVLNIQTHTDIGYARMATINARGDIAVRTVSGGVQGTYLVSQDGSYNRKIAGATSWVYYQDTTWLAAIGNTLYTVIKDTLANHYLKSFSKQVYNGMRNPMPASDFLEHYVGPNSGPGQLDRIEIVKRPSKGVLLNKNNQPILGNNNIILRADLDTLKYSAPGLPTRRDTIKWRAFDGLNWTETADIYLNLTLPPDTIKPFERNTLAGVPIRFWSSQFKENASNPLYGIKITKLPTWGKLTVDDRAVFYQRSVDITVAEIDRMIYTPNPNVVGVDTLQWMSFNTVGAYSPNDTPVILRIYPQLNTPPVLRTLESSYSRAAAPDTILIANYPVPQARTDVMVLLDNNQVLPIAPDHTFIISPSSYTTGTHQLKVSFKHKLDSISVVRSFTITNALAPLMMGGDKLRITAEPGPLSASPNPFSETLTVTGLDANKTYLLQLFDAQGKAVLTDRSFNQSKKVLELSGNQLIKGIYYLQVQDAGGKEPVKTIKLLHL